MVFNIQLVSCLSSVIVLINLYCFFCLFIAYCYFRFFSVSIFTINFVYLKHLVSFLLRQLQIFCLSTASLIFSSSPTAIFKFLFLSTANLILSSSVIANILSIFSISCFLFFANCNIHKYLSMSIDRFPFSPFLQLPQYLGWIKSIYIISYLLFFSRPIISIFMFYWFFQ